MKTGLHVHLVNQHEIADDVTAAMTIRELAIAHTKLTALGILHMVTIRRRPTSQHVFGKRDVARAAR